MSQTNLAFYLKQKRKKAGLSQKQVSDKLGYTTPQFVSNWERGCSKPPPKTLKKIGVMYQIPQDELFSVTLRTAIEEVTSDLEKKFYGRRSHDGKKEARSGH